jgi:hypothetical protein
VRNKLTTIFLVAVGLLTVSVPLLAHHGNAVYDYDKKVTVTGAVTEWIWANPHCFLKFDAKESNGEVKHWLVEAQNPPSMTRQGWSKNSFKPGDEVTVTVIQAKNGQAIGRFVVGDNIVLNGKPFPPGGGDAANAQAAPKP